MENKKTDNISVNTAEKAGAAVAGMGCSIWFAPVIFFVFLVIFSGILDMGAFGVVLSAVIALLWVAAAGQAAIDGYKKMKKENEKQENEM